MTSAPKVGYIQTKNSGMVKHKVYRQILNPLRMSRYPETAKQKKARA